MKPRLTILYATDFSPNAQHALDLACEVARNQAARLIVLHVVPPLPPNWATTALALPSAYPSECNDLARLRSVRCSDVQPERMLRAGEPAAVIVEVAHEINADLIVMGQPHSSRWRWLIEERVAQAVARTAPCPVLISARPGRIAAGAECERSLGSPPSRGARLYGRVAL